MNDSHRNGMHPMMSHWLNCKGIRMPDAESDPFEQKACETVKATLKPLYDELTALKEVKNKAYDTYRQAHRALDEIACKFNEEHVKAFDLFFQPQTDKVKASLTESGLLRANEKVVVTFDDNYVARIRASGRNGNVVTFDPTTMPDILKPFAEAYVAFQTTFTAFADADLAYVAKNTEYANRSESMLKAAQKLREEMITREFVNELQPILTNLLTQPVVTPTEHSIETADEEDEPVDEAIGDGCDQTYRVGK